MFSLSDIGFSLLAVSYLTTNVVHIRLLLALASLVLAMWGYLELSSFSTMMWNGFFFIVNLCYFVYFYWSEHVRKYINYDEIADEVSSSKVDVEPNFADNCHII